MNEEILYNEIYEKTKDCGRTQFVKLLMDKERENQELRAKIEKLVKCAYSTEMSLEEFKAFYKVATGEEYNIGEVK